MTLVTWQSLPVKATVKKITTVDKKIKQKQTLSKGSFPVIDQGQDFIAGYYNDPTKVIDAGPVIVFGDHTKSIKFVDFPFVPGADGTKVLKPDPELFIPKLFFYFLKCIKFPDKGYARHYQHLEKELISIPPLSEQEGILAKIEELFSELDHSAQLLNDSNTKAATLKQSLLYGVFSARGISKKKIEDIAKVGTGSTPLRTNTQFWENGSVPWVTSGALNQDFVVDTEQFVTELAVKNSRLKINPPNTLLVALYGEGKTRGKCSELTFEATTNQAIATIILDDNNEIDRKYLKWFLTMNYERVRQLSAGGVQPNLNLGIIKNIELPWPSREVKKVIIEKLDMSFKEIDRSKKEVSSMSNMIEAMRMSVLKKAFKGELV